MRSLEDVFVPAFDNSHGGENMAIARFHIKPWDFRLNGKERKRPEATL
ncbi:MAG: hypothetical protein V7L29_02370 [Nostoc sp.]